VIDVAVATTAFLDLTFVGLDEVPRPGQERHADDLLRSPGGGALIATAAARLGLDAALVSRLGADEAGDFIRAALEAEGVQLVDPHAGRTATTVVLPVDGERAMVTYDPRAPVRRADVDALAPRSVVCGLDQLEEMPADARLYATLGDDEARSYARRPPEALTRARAVLVNGSEARLLTGESSPVEAAERLAALAGTAVVTLGRRGAVGVVDGVRVRVDGLPAGPAIDTTGAGDLFAAAYAWTDLRGAEPGDRLRWAALYASLSVSVPTGFAGAVTEQVLIHEGTKRGLPEPPALGWRASSAMSSRKG
jgi:sugar/nucleoside kinase (ribokinase family)